MKNTNYCNRAIPQERPAACEFPKGRTRVGWRGRRRGNRACCCRNLCTPFGRVEAEYTSTWSRCRQMLIQLQMLRNLMWHLFQRLSCLGTGSRWLGASGARGVPGVTEELAPSDALQLQVPQQEVSCQTRLSFKVQWSSNCRQNARAPAHTYRDGLFVANEQQR